MLTLSEVMRLADSIDARYRLLVLLAVFASLRWGELKGLRKSDFDLNVGLVNIERSISLVGAQQIVKAPKTAAGGRTVALPMWLIPAVEKHFIDYSELLPDGRVFVGRTGVTPARPNFSPIWARALAKAEMTGIHVRDLRHTGNHLAAISGASTRELMARMGHLSVVLRWSTSIGRRSEIGRLRTRSMRWCGRSARWIQEFPGTLRARRLGSARCSISALVANLRVTRVCVVGADDGVLFHDIGDTCRKT